MKTVGDKNRLKYQILTRWEQFKPDLVKIGPLGPELFKFNIGTNKRNTLYMTLIVEIRKVDQSTFSGFFCKSIFFEGGGKF